MKRTKIDTIFITKYAATKGLLKLEVGGNSVDGPEITSIEKEKPYVYVRTKTNRNSLYSLGKEAFECEEEAKKNATKRFDSGILSARKKIARLEKKKKELNSGTSKTKEPYSIKGVY